VLVRVRVEATADTVKYVFRPAPPVARVRLGQILEANTLDAFVKIPSAETNSWIVTM
jgi:hypothetical protein